jgi:hypothetical protein
MKIQPNTTKKSWVVVVVVVWFVESPTVLVSPPVQPAVILVISHSIRQFTDRYTDTDISIIHWDLFYPDVSGFTQSLLFPSFIVTRTWVQSDSSTPNGRPEIQQLNAS